MASFAAPAAMQAQCPPVNTLPTAAGECCEFSMGQYRVWVSPQFRGLVAHFPLSSPTTATWNPATAILTSPLMIDGGPVAGGTLIAHSARHADGSAADNCPGTPVGTGANLCLPPIPPTYPVATVSDSHFTLQPTGFKDPGKLENHTEIVRLFMQDRGGFGAYVKAGPLAAPYIRAPQRSFGEAQASDNLGTVGPGPLQRGKSFFNVFTEIAAPQLRSGVNPTELAILYNNTPLLVQNELDSFPPGVVYLHENSSAVPVFFFGNSVNGYWNDADLFGFLVLSGHGVSAAANQGAIQAALASRPDRPVPEGGGAGPSGRPGLNLINGPTASTAFSPASLGVTRVDQVGMVPHPNGRVGEFLGGASVTGLPAGLGGAGGYDVVAFIYNRFTDTVTLNSSAAVFNTAVDEFALNWAPDGTYAVCDRFSATPVVLQAERTACGALGNLRPVAGIAGGIDPCPADIGGRRVLFYNDATNNGLSYRRHDVANATLLASPAAVNVALPSVVGNISHSSWPILGGDGEVAALLACEIGFAAPSTSRWGWMGDLTPSTAQVVHGGGTNSYENNGCLAGGRVYMATGGTLGVVQYDVLGMMGDRVPSSTSGGKVELMAFSPIKGAGATPDLTAFFAAAAYVPVPLDLTIFGFPGQFWGLDLTSMLFLSFVPHDNITGRAVYAFPLPLGLPPGLTLPVQGLTLMGTTWRTTSAVSVELF